MKIDTNLLNKINYWFALTIAFLMPFHKNIPELTIFWLFFWLLEGNFREKFENFKRHRLLFILIITYFCYHILAVIMFDFYTELKQLERITGFFLFPIFFLGSNKYFKKKGNIDKILIFFLIGSVLVSITKIFTSIFTGNYFYVAFVGGNPGWFALYNNFAIIIAFHFFLKSDNTSFKMFYLFSILILSLAVFFSSTRAGLLTLGIIFIFEIILIVRNSKFSQIFKIGIILTILVIVIGLLFNGRMNRMNSQAPRVFLIKNSLKIVKSNFQNIDTFLFGLGQKELKIEFKKRIYDNIKLRNLDSAHNDFLVILTKRGLIGFLIFVSFLFFATLKAIKDRDVILFLFLVNMIFNFMLNEIFCIRLGTYFFPFFSALLIFSKPKRVLNEI